MYLIYKEGGLWLDADTLVTGCMDWPVEDHDLVGCYNPRLRRGWGVNGILGNPIGGRQGSPYFKRCIEIFDRVRRNDNRWGSTSVGIFTRVYKNRPVTWDCVRYTSELYHPIPWFHSKRFKAKVRKGAELVAGWNPNAYGYHVTSLAKHIEPAGTLFQYIYQKSMCRPPACQPWSSQYLEWLPDGPLTGVEVGVMAARNMAAILQQRRDVTMVGVDTWTPRPTDWYADKPALWWERTYAVANKTLDQFVKSRWQFMRMDSVEAAKHLSPQDFVIIDADHSEEGCYRDLVAYGDLATTIMGHDYGHKNKNYGVTQAVNRYAAERGYSVVKGRETCFLLRKSHF